MKANGPLASRDRTRVTGKTESSESPPQLPPNSRILLDANATIDS